MSYINMSAINVDTDDYIFLEGINPQGMTIVGTMTGNRPRISVSYDTFSDAVNAYIELIYERIDSSDYAEELSYVQRDINKFLEEDNIEWFEDEEGRLTLYIHEED